jgi:tRNA pseudouridine38-40 synthase
MFYVSNHDSHMTQRIALGIEYDGSRFNGWQMQAHGTRTVQAVVQQALSIVADHDVQLTCAGRTDTGVHATGQVVHFDCASTRQLKAWVMGANAHLPDDVCVHWAREVDDEFSARFSAVMRAYRYIILNRRARSALQHGRVSWIYDTLDVNAMQTAAQALLGDQDFSSFRSAACQATHARRYMESIELTHDADYILVDIRANAFLHHMVRNIVGSLLVIGRGEQPESWLGELLELKDRTRAGPTAPPDGLYLVSVDYPQHYQLPLSGVLPRFA